MMLKATTAPFTQPKRTALVLVEADEAANDPKCGKCGAPLTTGMMAVLCPHGRDCEFVDDDEHWELIEDFRQDLGIERVQTKEPK